MPASLLAWPLGRGLRSFPGDDIPDGFLGGMGLKCFQYLLLGDTACDLHGAVEHINNVEPVVIQTLNDLTQAAVLHGHDMPCRVCFSLQDSLPPAEQVIQSHHTHRHLKKPSARQDSGSGR